MQIKSFSIKTKFGKSNKNCAKYPEIVFTAIFTLRDRAKKNNILIAARQSCTVQNNTPYTKKLVIT